MPLQPGFALIVRKAGVPIIPVGVDGAFKAWRRGTPMFRPHPVRVKFGPAIDVTDRKPAEIVTLVQERIAGLIAELRARNCGGRGRCG
jgi:1-acyl-sn-glycerol-3-phosphate acyltransferase